MKRILIVTLSVLAAVGLAGFLIRAFLNRHAETEKEAGGANAPTESRVKQNAQGEAVVTLDAETQKRVAVQVAALAGVSLNREIKVYGRVLDPAPLAALAAELASAQAAAKATQQEFERLKTLQQQDNASLRALQTAEAASRRDQLQVQSARDRLRMSWGNAILERRDSTKLVLALTRMEQVFVRLDLPAGEALDAAPAGARLVSLSAGDRPVPAEFFGPAPVVDPQTQGQGFLFLTKTNAPGLAPGAAVTGFLQLPGAPMTGVVVPRSAVLRYNGKAWVFVRTGDNGFTRREIALEHPTDDGWFLSAGLTANDSVVVNGAQTLLGVELNTGNFVTGQRD